MVMVAVPVVAVLLVVGGLVTVRLVRNSSAPTRGVANDAVVAAVTSVPASALDTVGVGSVTTAPKAFSSPPLTENGKPRVLYVGAEYCPYCAAERWGLVVALSRFGTFSGLGQTTSAESSIPTLTFHGSSYTSPTIAFTGAETEGNEVANGGYAPLDTLSSADQEIFATYNRPPYTDTVGSIPFVDFGGKYLINGASYSPQILQGKTHQQIASSLSDPSSPIARAVLGTANLITAAICASTNHAPSTVCSSSGVQQAAQQLS